MSRILFTALCLIGIVGILFTNPDEKTSKNSEVEIVKQDS